MVYSHSQIGTYLTCPLKYKFSYIDGFGKETKESSLNLILGSAVHKALEFIYKQRSNLITPLIEQMLEVYRLTFNKECNESTTEFLTEDKTVFFERGKIYLERYWSTYYPFDQHITMAVEQSFYIQLDDQISFRGYIDRIDVDGERMMLIDYKTNKQVDPDDEDNHHQQLTLYALGMHQKYGRKFSRIECRLIYLHLQKEIVREPTEDELLTIKSRYREHAHLIEQGKAAYTQAPSDTDLFPAKTGSHCQYCPFQMICPAWKHQYMQDEFVTSELGESTIKTLIDEYALMSKKVTHLEKEKKTIAQILLTYAAEHQLEKIYGNERKTSIQSRTYRSVIPEFERLLRMYAKENNLADELITTDTHALARLIQEGKIDTDAVHNRIQSKESSRLGPVSEKK